MTSIPTILSSIQNVHDLWQIAGEFPEMPFQIKKESNIVSASNDFFTVQAVFSKEQDVLIRRDILQNHSDKPIVFHRILSRFLLDPGDYQVYTQLNCWEKESLGAWQKLVTGITAEAPGMRACHSAAPMMSVWNEQTGRGIAYHLLAESAWKISIRQFWTGWRSAGVALEMGIHDGNLHYELRPGETLALPEIVFYPFRNRTDQDCHKLHDWFLAQNPSPVLPVVYNTWLYRFDWFWYEDIAAQVPIAADLGCEYFVIDAGWFGKEKNWGTSMGDYYERPADAGYGFGGRMADMADLVRRHGMKFGLWMEIERAGAGSDVLKEHGDLYIQHHGEYFLDFRKTEAAEYLLSLIDTLIARYGAEYLKFDCNGDMFEDADDGAFISYMQGYYRFIRELRRRHPDLYLLNCASGGMRMSLANARYFNSFWPTDNQNAYESLRILKDTLLRMPSQWIDRWLTLYSMPEFPYHYSENLTQDMTFTTGDGTWNSAFSMDHSFIRGLTAGGPIGLSCDLTKLSPDTQSMLRDTIRRHKEKRSFWQNCSVRILTDAGDLLVLQYTDPACDQAVICAFAQNVRQDSIRVYPVLSPDSVYISDLTENSVSGRELEENGILLSIRERYTCTQFTLTKSDQTGKEFLMGKKVALQIQHDQNWQKMLGISAANGFQYISMGFGSSKCFHQEDWGEEIAKIKSALDALGLRCVMTHAPYYDLRISADFLDDTMETALLRCVKATSMLGGEIMAIHPRGYYRDDGPVPENGFYDNGKEIPEESFRYNVQNLTPLVEEAVRCGCRIGVENLPVFPGWAMTFCSNFPDIHKRLIDALDPAGVCGVWDFGHSYLANADSAGVLASFGSRICGTHVHDNDRTGDSHLTPLTGTIDWKAEMAVLAGNGYDGYLTMELVYEHLYENPAALNAFVRTAYENCCKLDDMMHL